MGSHKKILIALLFVSFFATGTPSSFAANEVAQTFNYQGQFFNEAGTAPLLDTVDLTLKIVDPTGACLLYSEQQNNINLNTTNGLFSIQVGSLTTGPTSAKRTVAPAPATELDPGLPMELIFTNTGLVTGPIANCAAGYTASAGDGRILRVIVDDLTTSTTVTLSPDLPISAAPQAMNSQTLQGFVPANFIQVDTHMTQAAADLLTSAGDASSLHNHDSLYVKLNTGSTQNLGTGITYTTGDLGIGTATPGGALEIDPGAGTIGEIIKAKPTQTSDLLDVYGSGGTIQTSINSAGVLFSGGSQVASQSYVSTAISGITGTISGLTTNAIPYATSATALGSTTSTWDNTNTTLSVTGLAAHTSLSVPTVATANNVATVNVGSAIASNTGGAAYGANTASGYSGDLINLQVNGASKFRVDSTGNVTAAGVIAGGGTPSAFSFTNQTGVNLNSTIISNTVALAGITGLTPAACTGCTGIIRNGVLGSNTSAFLPGDTVAIQLLSSSSPNTAVTASLTIGPTTSSTWFVTTSGNTPNAFSFTNQTGVITNVTITSNTITLGGAFAGLTATCNAGCTGISRNGAAFTAGPVTGFNSGDTIAIQLLSSSSSLTAVTTTISIGGSTSGVWSVTTMTDPCASSPSAGAVCADGTVYVGLSPDGNVPMYTTRCDAGGNWNGSTCTGSPSFIQWSAGDSTLAGASSQISGKTNTATLVSDSGLPDAPYTAGNYCAGLNLNGHMDWYFPALLELQIINSNYVAVGGFMGSGPYWASSECGTDSAYWIDITNQYGYGYGSTFCGGGYGTQKYNSHGIRCVRHN